MSVKVNDFIKVIDKQCIFPIFYGICIGIDKHYIEIKIIKHTSDINYPDILTFYKQYYNIKLLTQKEKVKLI